MRIFKSLAITLCAVVLCADMAPGVKADQWNKKTIVTFNEPVAIPGQVLDPGTYVFKLLDSPGDRNVVQIWTGDEYHLLAMIATIPDYQPEPNDRSVFILDESSGTPPAALLSWFYAGEKSGQAFIYPEYPSNEEAVNTTPSYRP